MKPVMILLAALSALVVGFRVVPMPDRPPEVVRVVPRTEAEIAKLEALAWRERAKYEDD